MVLGGENTGVVPEGPGHIPGPPGPPRPREGWGRLKGKEGNPSLGDPKQGDLDSASPRTLMDLGWRHRGARRHTPGVCKSEEDLGCSP